MVYTWGSGENYGLGHGDDEDTFTPKLVTMLESEVMKGLKFRVCGSGCMKWASSPRFSGPRQNGVENLGCSVRGVGYRVWESGKPAEFLGSRVHSVPASCTCLLSPKKLTKHQDPKPKTLDQVCLYATCGGCHTAVCTQGGRLYTWGRGFVGQLGLGHDVSQSDVEFFEALPTNIKWSDDAGSTLNPGPWTLDLVPCTFGFDPKPWTLDPGPCTFGFDPKPWTLDPGP